MDYLDFKRCVLVDFFGEMVIVGLETAADEVHGVEQKPDPKFRQQIPIDGSATHDRRLS